MSFASSSLLIGSMIAFLGWIIKSQESVDLFRAFDEKKYDRREMSRVIGNNMMILGVFFLIMWIINRFMNNAYIEQRVLIERIVIAIIAVKVIFEIIIYGRVKSKNIK